jgi:type I restriction enzyme, S subunit
VAGIRERPETFFRLSPAADGKAQCFAVRRGEVGERTDAVFHSKPDVSAQVRKSSANWNTLGEMIELIESGSALKPHEVLTAGTPFYEVNNIFPYGFTPATEFTTRDNIKTLTKGDFVTGRVGSIGTFAVYRENHPVGFSDNVLRFRLSPNFSPRAEFLLHFLNSLAAAGQINKFRKGSLQGVINQTTLKTVVVPILGKPKETELVSAMNAARTACRTKLAEADALLSGLDDFLLNTLGLTKPPKVDCKVFAVRLRDIGKRADPYSNQSRFRKLFAALHKSKFRVGKFGDLAERIFSGITPLAKGDAYVPPPDGVRFIRSGEITDDGEVAASSEVHINSLIHEKMMKRSQLQQGDLLIAIVGATIGSTGVFNRNEPANINQAIAAVRLPDTDVSPEFACLFLHSSIGQALLDYFKRPVARANINLEEIGEIPMIIPPKAVQVLIVEESHRRRDQARNLRAEAEVGWKKAKLWFEEQLLGTTKP